jgi:hypothetical protein
VWTGEDPAMPLDSSIARRAALALPPAFMTEAAHFLATIPYDPKAFLIDEILEIDAASSRVRARLDTGKQLPLVEDQRGDPAIHPRHVAGPVLVQLTGMLGLVHAYFLHAVRFDQGWIGFGSRIHRADFKRLARLGPPLELESVETRARIGTDRHIVRYEFRFTQEGALCYFGDQTATWLRGRSFEGGDE